MWKYPYHGVIMVWNCHVEANQTNFLWSVVSYTDVIMTTMAPQITSVTIVYSTVYSDVDQRKHQSSASLALVRGSHRNRWIPRTKGQLRGKYFHLMTSSCTFMQCNNRSTVIERFCVIERFWNKLFCPHVICNVDHGGDACKIIGKFVSWFQHP